MTGKMFIGASAEMAWKKMRARYVERVRSREPVSGRRSVRGKQQFRPWLPT